MNEAAFIAAIKAAPDDDAPRLVYADWLDENDRSWRAALIRWQCRPERPETLIFCPSWNPDGWHWWSEPPPAGVLPAGPEANSEFPAGTAGAFLCLVRGFVVAVRCPTARFWLDNEYELIGKHTLQRVILEELTGWFYETDVIGEWVDTDESWDLDPEQAEDDGFVWRLFLAKAAYRWPGVDFYHVLPPPDDATPSSWEPMEPLAIGASHE